jgi:hypothetical protein
MTPFQKQLVNTDTTWESKRMQIAQVRKLTIVVLALLFGISCSACSAGPIASDWLKAEKKSPNGQLVLRVEWDPKPWRNYPPNKYSWLPNPQDRDIHDSHLLFLHQKGGKKQLVRSFCRGIKVLWSPDSNAFVVNDFVASDTAIPYLYRLSDPSHPIDLNQQLLATIDASERKLLESGAYVFLGKRWQSAHQLLVAIHGDTARGRSTATCFSLEYVFDLRKNCFRLKNRTCNTKPAE